MITTKCPHFRVLKHCILMSAVFLLSACDKELTTQSEQTVYKLSMNRTLDLSNESLSHVDVLLFDANNQSKEVLNNITAEGLYYPITFNKNDV